MLEKMREKCLSGFSTWCKLELMSFSDKLGFPTDILHTWKTSTEIAESAAGVVWWRMNGDDDNSINSMLHNVEVLISFINTNLNSNSPSK